MIKDFTPYHQALKLKALGFDEQCVAFFQKEYHEVTPIMVDDNDQYRLTGMRTCKNSEIPEHYTAASTFSQAFRWFREKYPDLDFAVGKIHNGANKYHYHINLQWEFFEGTYEEAELACLDKLLEIVETKSTQNTNDGRTMEKLIESNRKFDEKNNDNVKYDSSDRNEDMPNITNFFI